MKKVVLVKGGCGHSDASVMLAGIVVGLVVTLGITGAIIAGVVALVK